MDTEHKKIYSIFYPRYLEKIKQISDEKLKFVQYTSAESAVEIIRKGEVWLRNSQCMNDFSEVHHGLDCLVKSYNTGDQGRLFKDILDEMYPGITDRLSSLFDSWASSFKANTYLACVSEHPLEENEYGRLSMWRAYGGDRPVAIVLNHEPFTNTTDAFKAYSHPVHYVNHEDFRKEFQSITARIRKNFGFIQGLGESRVTNNLFDLFKTTALCSKHPGFKEEREWRVVYTPEQETSQHIKTSIETINAVPQEICKIPLKDIPDEGVVGLSVPEFIDRIIIGPNDQEEVMKKTFEKLLGEAGCERPEEKVFVSGIPLR